MPQPLVCVTFACTSALNKLAAGKSDGTIPTLQHWGCIAAEQPTLGNMSSRVADHWPHLMKAAPPSLMLASMRCQAVRRMRADTPWGSSPVAGESAEDPTATSTVCSSWALFGSLPAASRVTVPADFPLGACGPAANLDCEAV